MVKKENKNHRHCRSSGDLSYPSYPQICFRHSWHSWHRLDQPPQEPHSPRDGRESTDPAGEWNCSSSAVNRISCENWLWWHLQWKNLMSIWEFTQFLVRLLNTSIFHVWQQKFRASQGTKVCRPLAARRNVAQFGAQNKSFKFSGDWNSFVLPTKLSCYDVKCKGSMMIMLEKMQYK